MNWFFAYFILGAILASFGYIEWRKLGHGGWHLVVNAVAVGILWPIPLGIWLFYLFRGKWPEDHKPFNPDSFP